MNSEHDRNSIKRLYRELRKLDAGEFAQLTESDIEFAHQHEIERLEANMDRRDIGVETYLRMQQREDSRKELLRKQKSRRADAQAK